VQTALKLRKEDQQTIFALKKEIEKASKLVDSSHEQVWFYKNSNCMPWYSSRMLLCIQLLGGVDRCLVLS
jgi:hypothetical protein